ncbi:MAG: GTPase HflX [candidate division Zixibacteria bacterium]|nr:GTPase HflX [candidate division Zixibacteria bacterium]MDH3938222.1 GTPase HflX [candidate division Zixibacteria bacterium]MDH4032914.1 GTPase HflX [candidate division Zixibacteria bacterium]
MVIDNTKNETEKAILVGRAPDSRQRAEVEASLEELARLTYTAGAKIVAKRIQTRPRPDPAMFIGKGLVQQLKEQLESDGANCVIFDDTLSPAQQRNLEKALDAKVIDRPILILDIFANQARTRAARLQVELAQLEYTLPRLTGAWVHFSRQYGQIGSKGPGETQLEIDRRQVRTKIAHLKGLLKKLDKQRSTQRKQRQKMFKIAMVGYTNAGKSTLFNLLTRGGVTTADRLFTTLDSTTRQMVSRHPINVVISDTVGFIKKLPHQLVESFKSTLEEVSLADLLIHVVDCSAVDFEQRFQQTRQVLADIQAERVPYLLVYNKIDLNSEFVPPTADATTSFLVSASKKVGIAALQTELIARSQHGPRKNDRQS